MSLASVIHKVSSPYRHLARFVGGAFKAQDYSSYDPSTGAPVAPKTYGLLGAVGNMLTGSYDQSVANYNQAMNTYNLYQDDQRRAQQMQDDRNILEEQREYDSYSAQIQRMRDAGLSPMLMYQGLSGTGSAMQSPSYQEYEGTQTEKQGLGMQDLLSLAGFMQDIKGTMLGNKMMEEQIKGAITDNAVKGFQKDILGRQVADLDDYYKYQHQIRKDQLTRNEKELRRLDQDIAKADSEEELRSTLKKYGLNPNDPAIARVLVTFKENPELKEVCKDVLRELVALSIQSLPEIGKGIFQGLVPNFNFNLNQLIRPGDEPVTFPSLDYFGKGGYR